MDTQQLYRSLHGVTLYKVKVGNISNNATSLSNELNAFHAHVERENNETLIQAPYWHYHLCLSQEIVAFLVSAANELNSLWTGFNDA